LSERGLEYLSEEGHMKKLFMILPLVLILGFMVGCQNKEAMAELEEMKQESKGTIERRIQIMKGSNCPQNPNMSIRYL